MTVFTTLAGFLGVVVLVSAAWATYKATKGSKVAERAASDTGVLSLELNAYRERADRLDGELKQRDSLVAVQGAQIENLKQRTDLQPIMERLALVAEDTSARHAAFATNTEAIMKMVAELTHMTSALSDRIDSHEERAADRSDKIVSALEAITTRLEEVPA